ncbi:MAG TPA: AAA family ATPase [Nocardioidaceae bacterium]|nr:AAA family ATPase [Nocardioidaceae bacterium]
MSETASTTRPTANEVADFQRAFEAMAHNIEVAVVGKGHVVRLALTCLVTGGHLLLEDVPGTGKTMLARSLASTLTSTSGRIQFTPDLLPGDITGVTVYDQHAGKFEFHPGPVFHHLVLADEINRASPKTQSALLEVMEEGRVTVDGVTHEVPQPFMVIATQNPIEQAGTYRLPEAQLDRFLMKTSLGYPDDAATDALLLDSNVRDRATLAPAIADASAITELRAIADRVYVDPSIATYIRRIAVASRSLDGVKLGLSMRGALSYVRAVKTWAANQGRPHVVPSDVTALAQPVLCHRLLLTAEAAFNGVSVDTVVERLMSSVPPPESRA